MAEKPAGKVEHYYPKVQAAAVKLSKKVKVGDEVHIVGHGDDFKEKVTSLQLDHQPIQEGQPGQSVGLWVKDRVHEGDDVLLVTPDAKPSKPKAKAAKAKRKPSKAAKKAKKAGRKKAKAAKKARRKSRKAAKRFGKALAKSQRKAKKARRKAAKKKR
jgi:putative protease